MEHPEEVVTGTTVGCGGIADAVTQKALCSFYGGIYIIGADSCSFIPFRFVKLAELKDIAACSTVQSGNHGVVINRKSIISPKTVYHQSGVDVLIVVDPFVVDLIAVHQRHKRWTTFYDRVSHKKLICIRRTVYGKEVCSIIRGPRIHDIYQRSPCTREIHCISIAAALPIQVHRGTTSRAVGYGQGQVDGIGSKTAFYLYSSLIGGQIDMVIPFITFYVGVTSNGAQNCKTVGSRPKIKIDGLKGFVSDHAAHPKATECILCQNSALIHIGTGIVKIQHVFS